MRTATISLVLLACLGLTGCLAPRLDVPPGYVKMRTPQPYDFKAVSPRGVVIAMTARPNEDASADLAFWSQAVEHRKVDLDGLRLADREDVRSKSGRDGVLFHFAVGEGQGQVAYLVALFVTPQRIYTVEVGGPAELVTADREKLRTAIASAQTP